MHRSAGMRADGEGDVLCAEARDDALLPRGHAGEAALRGAPCGILVELVCPQAVRHDRGDAGNQRGLQRNQGPAGAGAAGIPGVPGEGGEEPCEEEGGEPLEDGVP